MPAPEDEDEEAKQLLHVAEWEEKLRIARVASAEAEAKAAGAASAFAAAKAESAKAEEEATDEGTSFDEAAYDLMLTRCEHITDPYLPACSLASQEHF